MNDTWLEKLKTLGASWSVYTAAGSFLLYALGYLVLRFQLSTWGVAADLAVLDERYLFAGARFLVYLTSTLLNVLLLGSPLLLAWWAVNRWSRFRHWRTRWNYALLGVIFAVGFIELVERKCLYLLGSVLLQPSVRGTRWLDSVLLAPSPLSESLFSAGLVAGVVITGWLLIESRITPVRKPVLEGLLTFLLLVEFLFLPVNFGVVISTRYLDRVANFAPAEAWLVWEGKERTTFLVEDADHKRKLVAIPNSEIKKLEVVGNDNIYQRLFAESLSPK